jgi:ribosomal protein S18 acetylase RimI-like enzyme
MTPGLRYTVNTSSAKDILLHLVSCDKIFDPALSTRVDLNAYASKLYENAVRFEAWSESELVGLIAAYFNPDSMAGFITNVSVLKEKLGKGIASALMQDCIKYAGERGYHEIALEVMKNNDTAIGLYRKFLFTESGKKDNAILMTCNIEKYKQPL